MAAYLASFGLFGIPFEDAFVATFQVPAADQMLESSQVVVFAALLENMAPDAFEKAAVAFAAKIVASSVAVDSEVVELAFVEHLAAIAPVEQAFVSAKSAVAFVAASLPVVVAVLFETVVEE